MLTRRLVELAGRAGSATPFHRERQFSWQLDLNGRGELESRQLLRLETTDGRGRPTGVIHPVPTMVRTVGVAPNLTADDAQYVLGWADEDSKPARVAQCHATFVDLHRRWADNDVAAVDPVARAVTGFLTSGAVADVERPDDCAAKAGILIAVEGTPAFQAASVASFWSAEVARRKGSAAGLGLCLTCGQVGPLLDTLPGKVPSRLVPGATNDSALVSVNERVFGYGLSTQLGPSPICMACGEGVTAGLVYALAPERSATYGGQDSRMAWWTTEPTNFDPMAMLNQPAEDQVIELVASVHDGRATDTVDPANFCSMTVGGNVARIVVRDWVEMPLTQLKANIAQWFVEQEMEPTRQNGHKHHGIGRYALVSGRWLRDAGRYADFGSKGADRPDGVHRDLVRAAVRATSLPPSLLAHLVHRIRTDGRLDDARASLIRLILVRSPLTPEKPMAGLNQTNTTPAYIAGRTFAVLEQIQYDASDPGMNTTYGDRYFAGAISNPQLALVNGRRDAIAWLRKLRRRRPGAYTNHEKRLDELFGLLDCASAVPTRATLQEQALFLLGYHHQRAHHFASIRSASATARTSESAEENS